VGGRLRGFAHVWRTIQPGDWVLQTVSQGYRIEFSSTPPSGNLMLRTPIPQLREKREALEKEVRDLLQKGATRVATAQESTNLFRSSFFLAPKKPDRWRPILNLKPLNKAFIIPRKFRMETLVTITPFLKRGQWATSIDLKDAYLHVPVHKDHQRFLAFSYRNTDYVFRAMPFGLSTAPRVFTRISRTIVAFLRRRGFTVFAYLDDWLIVGPSRSETARVTSVTVSLLESLGWVINMEKSSLIPSQSVIYLGARLDFERGTISASEKRAETLVQLASDFPLQRQRQAREWLRLLGVMASLVDIIPLCKLRMRPLQFNLLSQYSPASDDLSKRVTLEQGVEEDLAWWTSQRNVGTGRPFQDPRPLVSFNTDASLSGWGAVLGTLSTSGQWTEEEAQRHINWLELEAVHRAILHWSSLLQEHRATVVSDSTTAVAYINRQGGTKSRTLYRLARAILETCEGLRISLRATHLAGKENTAADALSRQKLDHSEWSLAQPWADLLFETFDRPLVDLFATGQNCKLPTFCSRFFDPRAWATDALSFQWDNLFVYAFPPWCLLQQVLLRIQSTPSVEVLLVAPCWPNQPWFPLLLELLCDQPLLLPAREDILTQHRGRVRFHSMRTLHLSAWRLSGSRPKQRDFLRRLQTFPRPPGEGPRLERTIRDWTDSEHGQQSRIVIPWRRQ